MPNLADQLKTPLEMANSIAYERENFRSLFRQTPELVCITRGPNHVFDFVNEAHINGLGFDATGQTVREAQPESVEIHGILDNVYRTGETALLHEIPVTLSDRLRYFNLTYAPTWVDGAVTGIVIMGQEVTDQVLTREILKGQNLALEMTLKNTPLTETLSVISRNVEYHIGRGVMVAVHLIDSGTRTLRVEAAPSLPHGYKESLDGRAVDASLESAFITASGTVIKDIGRDLRWRAHRDLAKKFGLKSCWLMPIQAADGHLLGTFVMYNRPPHDPSTAEQQVVNLFQHTTAVCIQRHLEVTERADAVAALRESEKRLRQAQEVAESANSAKGLFLANMSHEIRTPLGAIMGFLDLMKDSTTSPDEFQNYIGVMERNSRQLLRIVDEVLDLSKIEAGKFLVESVPFSLEELLTDIHALMAFKAKEKGLLYTQRMSQHRPDRVVGDPIRVRQILINVIGNAIKFTDRGFVSVDIAFAGDLLMISVEDTGCGISPQTAKRLFRPFSQADSSTTRLYGGTGLGLTLTMRLCQALGGNFILDRSEVGQGSKFVATLQLKPVIETPAENKATDSCPSVNGLFDGVRVLVIDDSLDNQELIGIMLSRMGAKIDVAVNGSEALERAPKGNYDLLLMDIQMPVMDGHEATRRLRGMGFRKPILALTAHAMKEERCRCQESGFSGFMSKPINKDDLIKAMLEWTRH